MSDAETITSLASISHHAGTGNGKSLPLAVAALYNSNRRRIAEAAYQGPLAVVDADRMVARILAQSVLQPCVWDVYAEEKSALVPWVGPFDGFHETTAAASKTCLARFDRNRYSVMARAANRPVSIRAYAGRVEIRLDGEIIANHPRVFNREQVVYDPWHYLPVLARKPG